MSEITPEKREEVYNLLSVGGLTQTEIAARLGLSRDQVYRAKVRWTRDGGHLSAGLQNSMELAAADGQEVNQAWVRVKDKDGNHQTVHLKAVKPQDDIESIADAVIAGIF